MKLFRTPDRKITLFFQSRAVFVTIFEDINQHSNIEDVRKGR